MIDKKTLSTMADIMDGIVQSEEWAELQMNDPGIKAAESRLRRAMENARAYLPAEDYMELSDAQTGEVSAHCDVALLYGMRVTALIQAATANPSEMTRFLLERVVANR